MSDSEVVDEAAQAGGNTEVETQAEEDGVSKEEEAVADEKIEEMPDGTEVTVVNPEMLDFDTGEIHGDDMHLLEGEAEAVAVQSGNLVEESRPSGDAVGSIAEGDVVEEETAEDKEDGKEEDEKERGDGEKGEEGAEEGENVEIRDETQPENDDEEAPLEKEGESIKGKEREDSEAKEVREGDESEPKEREEGDESEPIERKEGYESEPIEREETGEDEHPEVDGSAEDEQKENKETEEDVQKEGEETGEREDGTPEAAEEGEVKEEQGEEIAEGMIEPGMEKIEEEEDDEPKAVPLEFTLRKAPVDSFTLEREYDENDMIFSIASPPVSTSDVASSDSPDVEHDPEDAPVVKTMADREREAELFREQLAEHTTLRRRNLILQKKLMQHFKTRKMNAVFREPTEEVTPEMEATYAKRLMQYSEMQAEDLAERTMAKQLTDQLEADEAQLSGELQELIDAFIDHERETSQSLVSRKNGKPINEKLVERLLKAQRTSMKTTGEAHFDWIRVREKVAAKEKVISDLEDLGQNLKIMDFEQLRIENQNLIEKIEERDEETSRHRTRALHSIQVLSHYREKMIAVLIDIDREMEEHEKKQKQLAAARSEMSKMKSVRDKLRADYQHEASAAGLLTKPQLLRDFEETQDTCDALRAQLDGLRTVVAEEQRSLNVIRAFSHVAAKEIRPNPSYKDKIHKRIEEQRTKRTEAKLRPHLGSGDGGEGQQLLEFKYRW